MVFIGQREFYCSRILYTKNMIGAINIPEVYYLEYKMIWAIYYMKILHITKRCLQQIDINR